MTLRAATGLALVCLAGTGYSQIPELAEYTANYEATANGLAASATRSLSKLDENSYRLSNSLTASLAGQTLAKLEQSSEFELAGASLVPLNYSYLLTGVSRASHAIAYNWQAMIAASSEDGESWQLELRDGVFDQLSYQAALRRALITDSENLSSFSFEIIDGDEIDSHEYRVAGEEIITTPLGELDTLKLERVREADDERVTEIWLAKDWDFLMARLEQLNGSGLRIVLELKSAEIDGEAVGTEN